MIATLSPRARPIAASPQASARTSSHIWRQVQVCQIPRSFSRIAILLGCYLVRSSSSFGNVSRTLSWGIQAFSVGDDLRRYVERRSHSTDYVCDCKGGIVHYRTRNCNAKLLRG